MKKYNFIITSLALLALTLYLGYGVERSQFEALLAAYGAFFGVYGWIVLRLRPRGTALNGYLGLGVALRVALLFSLPNLSDDFYRFLWDGRLLANGIHPFSHLPDYFIQNNWFPAGITPELYAKLNSPHYHTVYPPINQAVFWLAAQVSPHGIWGGVLVLKLFLLACELGTLWLLRRPWDAPSPGGADRALLYALNPLVIVEIMGNCHFEGAVILCALAGLYGLAAGRAGQAALAWAMAVAAKLTPLLFVPLLLRRLGGRRALYFAAVFGFSSLLFFIPLFDLEVLRNMASSLNLYFQTFAFNASLFYVARWVCHWYKWYDWLPYIGPFLGACTALGVLLPAVFYLHPNAPLPKLAQALTLAALLYLLNASTVHPWYVLIPFAFSLFTSWRLPLVWTGAVILSYHHYAHWPYEDNFYIMGMEYGILAVIGVYLRVFAPPSRLRS